MSKPNPVVIVDVLGECVTATQNAILADLQTYDPFIEQINYQYGPPLEIYETLAQMSGIDQGRKYPLIAVFQPFIQQKGRLTGIDSIAKLRIIIARWRNQTDKTPQRYDENFKPILYKVYAELLYQISVHKAIASPTWEKIPHDYKDWPYWDNDGKNPIVDCADIIELSNLELNFRFRNCF